MDLFDQKISQNEINRTLWSACDTFRGAFDSSEYKNYILVFMFLKYLSDIWKDHYAKYRETYGDNEELIRRKMSRERFVLPENCTFDYLFAHRNEPDIGEKIDKVLAHIEDENQEKLSGVFRNISFNSEKLGQTKDRNRRLKNLITDFAKPELDFRPSRLGDGKVEDYIGNAYMYLIEKFASGAGKKGGEFYTPHEISDLIARLLAPQAGSRIYDPTCGSGYLLVSVAEHVRDREGNPSRDFALYGQESNGDTWALCKMNMFLHGMDAADIAWGDTLNDPKHIEAAQLMKFDVVVANPPFSLDKWGAEDAEHDSFKRFWRGVPPKSKADYAFLVHMIESTNEQGRVGVVVPHGVLFRGSSEGRIRQQLLEDNLLEAVVGLPSNLFYGTGIPAAILIFNRKKISDNVLFIDASNEYEAGKRQNRLREADIMKITEEYQRFREHEEVSEGLVLTDKFSYIATKADLEENDYNLNIPRYVDTFEEEEPIDIPATQQRITELEKELAEVQQEMNKYLAELGF
ncbi:MAG: type I restriction-modification system subunit M [Cyclobacteriaceae bacterium]